MTDEIHADEVPAQEVRTPQVQTAEVRMEEAASQPAVRREGPAVGIGIAAWLLPGLGHAMLKMWGRAIACFLTVAALVYVGAGMRGNLFTSEGGDAFATLGYVADLGAGSFYFIAKSLEKDGPDVSHADGDYGTRFLAAAGVLNLLAALHAYEAARGRKA
jgi:hypothetical protein